MEKRIQELVSYIDDKLGDTDPYLDPDMSEEDIEDIIKDEYPLFYIHTQLIEILKRG